MHDDFLFKKLEQRREQNALRQLRLPVPGLIDFCSNDYLGIVRNRLIPPAGEELATGSTGSRLLTGNYPLMEETEAFIARFHQAPAALIFNSGYDANLGLLSALPQKEDTILYDQLAHASIRDGIRLSFASSRSFLHNDPADLEEKLKLARGKIFVVTESVFSMDGDLCPLKELVALCEKYGACLVVDEAHATGVIGEKGEGLVQSLGLENRVFARVHTFGKACGCHGAVVLGSEFLREFLVNFARPFIYTTALPATSVAHIRASYAIFPGMAAERAKLAGLVAQFQAITGKTGKTRILASRTPIQGIITGDNTETRELANRLQANKLDVRPILYPTVPKGTERLRIVLHAFNTPEELDLLLNCL